MYKKNEDLVKMIAEGKQKIAESLNSDNDSAFAYWDGYTAALEKFSDVEFLKYEKSQQIPEDGHLIY